MTTLPNEQESERRRRWRLILGGGAADGLGVTLHGVDLRMDDALAALYDAASAEEGAARPRRGGLGASAPTVARWLGDIRTYFPSGVVRVMQEDALERLNLKQMLLEPEFLQAVEPDVELAATLISLSRVMPQKSREIARSVVRKVVEELERRLANPVRQAILGSLQQAARTRRPKPGEIDWGRTIRTNLQHYLPDHQTVILAKLVGFGRRRTGLRDIILCIDQSGSMASSVVYASVFGAVLASLRAVQTHIVVFDTAVVDLTAQLDDPVELLFGVQLGGGTDIKQALAYCQSLIQRPEETILVLISDLYEGGNQTEMLKCAHTLVNSGVQMVALLALDDHGAPGFDHANAAALAQLDIPAFACTPDLFPDLMASAINRQDIGQWAARHELAVVR